MIWPTAPAPAPPHTSSSGPPHAAWGAARASACSYPARRQVVTSSSSVRPLRPGADRRWRPRRRGEKMGNHSIFPTPGTGGFPHRRHRADRLEASLRTLNRDWSLLAASRPSQERLSEARSRRRRHALAGSAALMALALVAATIEPAAHTLRSLDTTTHRFAAPLLDRLLDVPAQFRSR